MSVKFDFTPEPCCPKPALVCMDHVLMSPFDNSRRGRVNRVCLSCWRHWYGDPEAVWTFTNEEWDARLEAEAV